MPGFKIRTRRELWILTHREPRNIRRVRCFMRFVGGTVAELLKRSLGSDAR